MRILIALSAVAVLLVVAGCGAQSEDSPADGSSGPVSMKAALIPTSDTAPIPLGVEKRFFVDRGIDLTVSNTQGGAASISGVVSGDFQLAYTGTVPYMQARASGIKLHVLAGGGWATQTPDAPSNGALLVTGSSPIRNLAELNGKKVGVNSVKGVLELAVGNRLIQAGVEPSSVTFVEIPISGMLNSLKNGTVDAVALNDPYRTMGLDSGDRVLADIYSGFNYPFMPAVYVTSQAQYDENPERFDALADALDEALSYAENHQSEVRNILPAYAKLDPDLAQRIMLQYWTSQVNIDSAREQADLARKVGILSDEPHVDEWFEGAK